MEELNLEEGGDLGIICMPGCERFVDKVEYYLKKWNGNPQKKYTISAKVCRFATGEAKGLIKESCRGKDIYIITDCFNYSVTYKMYEMDVPMTVSYTHLDVYKRKENSMPNIDLNMILKLQQVFKSMNVNDKNSQLLLALKPHFSERRQAKVDQAISMMRLMNMLPMLKESGIFSGL